MTDLHVVLFTITAAVAIVGFYATAAFIVAKTGSTEGISDLGKSVARIIRALFVISDDE